MAITPKQDSITRRIKEIERRLRDLEAGKK